MALQLIHLDQRTRRLMSEELDQDIAEKRLYLSPRLSERGRIDWPSLLREAIDNGDEQSLAQALRNNGRINPTEHRRTRSALHASRMHSAHMEAQGNPAWVAGPG